MKPIIVSFLSGVLFAIGIGIGGMTQPGKVVGFLDFAGNWDPSLAFVMIGAVAVNAVLYRMIRARRAPMFTQTFSLPTRKDVDRRLIIGASIFGLGWGLAGYCPAPGLTSIVSGQWSPLVFSIGMLAGMLLYNFTEAILQQRRETITPIIEG